MDEVICLPPYGKKKKPLKAEELFKIARNYYDNPNMDSYKTIYSKRPEYAWMIDKHKTDFEQNYVRETIMGNIVKGVMFADSKKGKVPIGHYTYILNEEGVAYLDFITSFLLKRGILTKLMPRIVQEMKEKGVKTIKLVPYHDKNLKVFQKKFRFRKEGDFLIRTI
jgi:hypothetical protein